MRFTGKQKYSLLLLAASVSTANAGGFDLPTVIAAHQGSSNANAAEAADPSVIYYNPAGLAKLSPGIKVSQGFTALLLDGKVEVDRAASKSTPAPNEVNSSTNLEDVPNVSGEPGSFWPAILGAGGLFISLPLNDEITAGLGVFAPAGGNLNYKSNWAGAYHIDAVAIETVNINPSIAIRFDDQHSFGLGVSVLAGHLRQKVQVDVEGVAPYLLAEAVRGGTAIQPIVDGIIQAGCSLNLPGTDPLLDPVCLGLFNTLGSTTPVVGLIAPNSSANAQVEMYGYGFGFNAGYMFDFNDKTRLSLAYRSESTIKMQGTLDWDLSNLNAAAPLGPLLVGGSLEEYVAETQRPDTDAEGDIIIPARTSVSVFHKLTPKIDLMADFTFIESSAVKQVKVYFEDREVNGRTIQQGAGGIDFNWEDSYKFSIGGNYHVDDKLTLRTGFQFDKTPIPSAEFRHPSAPDSDRYMYSLGAGYKAKDNLSIDAAYSAVFLADSESNYRDRCRYNRRENEQTGAYDRDGELCTGNGGTFVGRFYDTIIHVLSVQINQKF